MNPILPIVLCLSPAFLEAGQEVGERTVAPDPLQEVVDLTRGNQERRLMLYEIVDLTLVRHPVGLEEEAPLLTEAERKERIATGSSELADLVRKYIEPPLDDLLDDLRVTSNGTLVLSGLPSQHEWLNDFLRLQRRTTDLFQIETRFLEAPRGSFEEVGVTSSTKILETGPEITEFLRSMDGLPGVQKVLAPQVVSFGRQRVTITVGNQVAYVKTYELKVVEPGAVELVDPVVDTLWEGNELTGRAVALPGGLVGLELNALRAQVERPIPTRPMRVTSVPPRELEVGMPVVTQASISADVLLVEGSVVVLVTPANDPENDLAIAVRVRRIEALDAKAEAAFRFLRGETSLSDEPEKTDVPPEKRRRR